MKNYKIVLGLLSSLCLLMFTAPTMHSQDKNAQGAVQVHLVVTNEAQRGDEVPTLQQGDVKVKQGKSFLKVNQLIPAKGDNAALQLFVLIDDTLDTGVGSNLNDIRDFINAQPATTVIAVGYMSNAAVQVAQNFTADHNLAAKALRLPRGSLSTMDSPYLSLISLVKGWPQQNVRREVLMMSDGIDRLRGEQPTRTLNSSACDASLWTHAARIFASGPGLWPRVSQHAYHEPRRELRQRDQPALQRDCLLALRRRRRTSCPKFLGSANWPFWPHQARR
jgi:hypothetical protein